VLAAARKHASVEALEKHVATGQALRLNLPKRQQRTSKKAAGRRGKRSWTSTAGKKKKRKQGSKKVHKKRDHFRRPKAKKNPSLEFTVKQVRMAVQKLRASGWLVEKNLPLWRQTRALPLEAGHVPRQGQGILEMCRMSALV
jgi:hypothetical protein